jgi:class 3 adenylate cyclase
VNFVLIAVAVLVVAVAALAGFLAGRRSSDDARSRSTSEQKRLEEYDFYPFFVTPEGHVEFDPEAFNRAVLHLLTETNKRAARELVVIGEQNLVRDTFPSDWLLTYKQFYAAYNGDSVVSDNDAYLENYKRVVNQLGRSFRNAGIEVLLHNLVNPSRSLVAIENGAVTGRRVGSGATNLVLDLKTRKQRGEDKVNYELNIGSRQFKCTTVGIFRPEYGLVGALCVNIDRRFLRDAAAAGGDRIEAVIENIVRTDFELDENILSKDEYMSAQRGKRHYLDEAVRSGAPRASERTLAAILFSDIVGFTALMGEDEARTLDIMESNDTIHASAIASNNGMLLKKLGDGILASFDSASSAVACATELQRQVAADGRYQIRVGIHLGEVVRSDGDVHGDGVNIASRVQDQMGPGEIGATKVVYDNIKNKDGISTTPPWRSNAQERRGTDDPLHPHRGYRSAGRRRLTRIDRWTLG